MPIGESPYWDEVTKQWLNPNPIPGHPSLFVSTNVQPKNLYRLKPVKANSFKALHITNDLAMKEVSEFCNDLVYYDDTVGGGKVYNRITDVWQKFYTDDWLYYGDRGELRVIDDKTFTDKYEAVPTPTIMN